MEYGDQDLLFLIFTNHSDAVGGIVNKWLETMFSMLEESEQAAGNIDPGTLGGLRDSAQSAHDTDDHIAKIMLLLAGLRTLRPLRDGFYPCCPCYKLDPWFAQLDGEWTIYMDGLGDGGTPDCATVADLKYPDATAFVAGLAAMYISM